MKPITMHEILNYGFYTQALRMIDSSDYTEDGFDANNLSLDYFKWRSKGTSDVDIYTELYDAQSINCCFIQGANVSSRSSVVLSGSNSSGVGGFYDPLFQESLTYINGNWILLNNNLPECKYYRISISDPAPVANYFEIGKIFLGITKEFPLEVIDGWMDSNESKQKRDIQNGQWNQGTENSIIKTASIPFRSLSWLVPQERVKIEQVVEFLETVKTSTPFLFILYPTYPEIFCQYVVISGDSIELEVDEAHRHTLTLELKESK